MNENLINLPEAREWLVNINSQESPLAGNRFDLKIEALGFVSQLYEAGAVQVLVDDIHSQNDGSSYATTLVVVLPSEAESRAGLFAIYNQEKEEYGENFGGSAAFEEITREQALAMGDPDAEGELSYIEGPLEDVGQPTLIFWWD